MPRTHCFPLKCYSCGEKLGESNTASCAISFDIVIENYPLDIQITGGIVSCSNCGQNQFLNNRKNSNYLNDAIVNAFKNVSLKP